MTISSFRSARWLGGVSIVAAVALAGCHNILDVQYPGQIPTSQINDPSLAAVLVRSVIGDFECAYSNYMSGSSVHSDEYETANSNVPLANWGERTITADENDYAIGTCEGNFGMNLTLHTARFQAEDVSTKLAGWTDQQVPGRVSLQAQAKIYAAYAYLLMGEGFCQVAFDGGAAQPPTAALTLAETRFTEGLAFAQQAGNTDMLDLGRVGMARAKLDLKKWSEDYNTPGIGFLATDPMDIDKTLDSGTLDGCTREGRHDYDNGNLELTAEYEATSGFTCWQEIDTNHQSRILRNASPMLTAATGAISCR